MNLDKLLPFLTQAVADGHSGLNQESISGR